MATVSVNPFKMGDATLTIGADDFIAAVSSVNFTPASSTVTWKGLTPTSVFSFGTTATWTATIEYAQDWETLNSLSNYLFTNEGDEVVAVFEPVAGGPAVTATIIVSPGGIGGAIDAVAIASVTLGVKGKPVITPAA